MPVLGGGHTTLRAIIEDRAAELASLPFLVMVDGRLSYGETDELANRTANALAGVGVATGDIVMARCGNATPMVATWFGCNKLGAVFMPVNPLLTGEPLRRVMAHAGAKVAVCDQQLLAELAEVRAGLPALETILVARETPAVPRPRDTCSFAALVEAAPSARPPPLEDDPAAPAKLSYTSGTTGTPKAVVWSRACEATWARCYGDELIPIAPGESTYCCLPLSHITCQGTMLATMWRGGRITVDDGFDPFGYWNRVRRAEASVFSYVGTLLSVLGRRPERSGDADNPVWRVLGSAAPIELWRDIERRFGLEIAETWGQTETASCWTRPESMPQRPGSVGRPSSRFESRLVGPDGTELGPGLPGELWIRPNQAHVMFEGYLAPGGVSSASVSREDWTDEGWYRTGDVLVRLDDGELSFVGRQREAIRRRGEMIPAGDVEEAALSHPAVAEAAAVGVTADDGVEDEIKLCVVPEPGEPLDPGELHAYLCRRLPRFMQPRYVEVRPELPKTPSTRVQKYRLRQEGPANAWDSRPRYSPPG